MESSDVSSGSSLPLPSFTDASNDPIISTSTSTHTMTDAMQLGSEVVSRMREILECIHVSHKYALITQKPLPPELDYFAQNIVGNLAVLYFNTLSRCRTEWSN